METTVQSLDVKVAWSSEDKSRIQNDNIGSLWTDFTQNTGFHGVNKLTPGRNYKFRCFWWTLAVMSMTAYMSYNISKELISYYKYPTTTSMKAELVEELTFPAVTICSQSPFSMTKVRAVDPDLEEYFEKTSIIGPFMDPVDWKTQFLGSTFHESKSLEWWGNISMDLDTLYYYCMMGRALYEPCTKAMEPVVTNYGLCATFNFNTSDVRRIRLAGSDNGLILFANIMHDDYVLGSQLAAGLRVILHEPDVHPDAATSSFLTSPGTTTYAVVKKSTFKYMPKPFKAFANRTCVDTTAPGFNNTLEFFDTYTYEHCILECQMKKINETCGCSKQNDDESLGPICSIFNLSTCYYPKFEEIGQDIEFRKSCGCKLPCSFSTYDAKLSTSKYPSNIMAKYIKITFNVSKEHMQDNFLEIRIYYDQLLIQTTEQIAQYNTETVIGNLGGQMGICLGASILTLTELGEFIVIVLLTVFRRVTHGGEIQTMKPIAK